MAAPNNSGSVTPNAAEQSSTVGSTVLGTPSSASSRSSQRPSWISNSSVRDALVASVACTLPPVSRHNKYVSTVPNANSPRAARSRILGAQSNNQASFVPEKYGSSRSPG